MAVELNGMGERRVRVAAVRGEKSRGKKGRTRKAEAKPLPLRTWAYGGVGLTLGLSGWLNGLAFSAAAPVAWHGWALGVAIPAGILVFSRVAAILYADGRRGLAYAGAVACLSMLLLSVQHVAVSIARLTGEPVGLAALMALAVDLGLVVCELATVAPRL